MEKSFERVEELAETISEYINNRIEEVKLTAIDKSSALLSNMIAGVVVVCFFVSFIVFASIALSLFLGEWLNKVWLGFLIVAVMYLMIGIIVWAARGRIIRLRIMNSLIQQLFKNETEDEKD